MTRRTETRIQYSAPKALWHGVQVKWSREDLQKPEVQSQIEYWLSKARWAEEVGDYFEAHYSFLRALGYGKEEALGAAIDQSRYERSLSLYGNLDVAEGAEVFSQLAEHYSALEAQLGGGPAGVFLAAELSRIEMKVLADEDTDDLYAVATSDAYTDPERELLEEETYRALADLLNAVEDLLESETERLVWAWMLARGYVAWQTERQRRCKRPAVDCSDVVEALLERGLLKNPYLEDMLYEYKEAFRRPSTYSSPYALACYVYRKAGLQPANRRLKDLMAENDVSLIRPDERYRVFAESRLYYDTIVKSEARIKEVLERVRP